LTSYSDAYDNAEAESVMSTIKNALVNRHRFKTRNEARLAVFGFIEGFYKPAPTALSTGLSQPDGLREDMGGGR
jgi:putative transposase